MSTELVTESGKRASVHCPSISPSFPLIGEKKNMRGSSRELLLLLLLRARKKHSDNWAGPAKPPGPS